MSAFDQIRDVYFGSARMPMRLNARARRRVFWTSIAPATVVIALFAHTALSIVYDGSELYGGPFGYGAPFLWRRVDAVSQAVMFLDPAALGLLFAAGLQSWTRAEGLSVRRSSALHSPAAHSPSAPTRSSTEPM